MAENTFLLTSIKQFEYYKSLGEKSFMQLTDEALFSLHNPQCNSIAVIVQHLHGNMLSRWTDFLTTDGEKSWRNRDLEFEPHLKSRKELLLKWEEGWSMLLNTLRSLQDNQLNEVVYIRNMGHTVQEAIMRQLCHYSYHVGQIVLLAKIYAKDWTTLSIAKGGSELYNKDRFSKVKSRKHFIDDINESNPSS